MNLTFYIPYTQLPEKCTYQFAAWFSNSTFNAMSVEWKLSGAERVRNATEEKAELDIHDTIVLFCTGGNYRETITALYTYNGKTYEDSFMQTEEAL